MARYLPDSDKVLRSALSLTSKGLYYRANGPLAARIGFKWRIIAGECAAESASALEVLQGREQSQNFLSGAYEHSIVWGFKPGFVLRWHSLACERHGGRTLAAVSLRL